MVCQILTTLLEARSIERMNDQRRSYGADDKCSSVQQIHVKTAVALLVRKNWTHTPSNSGSYGRLADKIQCMK